MYAILFDMDGVLVDTEPVINAAAIQTLKEFGVHALPDDFLPFVGTGEVNYIGGVAEKYGVAFQPAMKERLYQIYLEMVEQHLKPQPGVHECLKSLRQASHPMALASSADHIKIDANLRVAQISPTLFDVILGGDDVTHKKPDPEIYLKAAQSLGVSSDHCIVVEDAVNGIQAANAAGMISIGLATTFSRSVLAKENPDYLCDDLEDVCRQIEKLSS